MSEWTREKIVDLLKTNDKAVARALVVLFNNQTSDEQSTETTRHHNGKGFTGTDAKIGTSMAKFYMSRGYLSPKQLNYWRKPNKHNVPKIGKYSAQLIAAIGDKAA